MRAARSPSGRAALLALAVVCALPGLARAQAAAPAAPEPPPRLEASGQFAFLDTRGNADTQSLGAGGELVFRPAPWTYNAKVVFAQTETEDEVSARSFAGLFRASRALNARLSAYGQYDFLRDVFAGVEQRHILEGGASYLAIDAPPHRLRFDAGLGYLYEERPDDHFDSLTLSLGAAYRLAISSSSELTYEPRFLLPFADSDAWKFDQNVALAAALNSILSLKLAHTVRYSADPPEGFDTTDRIMSISVVARLRRPR
jgi:putative salt-induced outer membrane protein YdiY